MIYLEILILVISPLLFAGITWYFLKLRGELHEKERLEMTRIMIHNQRVSQDEVRIRNLFEDNKLKSRNIIRLSEKLAQELIVELEQALGIERQKFAAIVLEGDTFEEKLQFMSKSLKNEYVKKIIEIVTSLDEFEKSKAHLIEDFGEKQLFKTETDLQKMKSEELKAFHVKLEKYKQEEIALFNKKVEAVVQDAAKEFLGKALSVGEHEDLVIKALESARKKNAL